MNKVYATSWMVSSVLVLAACASEDTSRPHLRRDPYRRSDMERIATSVMQTGSFSESGFEIHAKAARLEADGSILLLSDSSGHDVAFRWGSHADAARDEETAKTMSRGSEKSSELVQAADLYQGIKAHDAIVTLQEDGGLWIRAWDVSRKNDSARQDVSEFGFTQTVMR